MAKVKIGEIRALLMGKRLTYYDSFGGSLSGFTIGYIAKVSDSCVRCFQARNQGWGVYVPIIAIEQLVNDGYFEMVGELEHIRTRQSWTLTD